MKRKSLIWVLLFALAASALAGCGVSKADSGALMYSADSAAMAVPQQAVTEEAYYDVGEVVAGAVPTLPDSDAKIIYTADLDLETTDFDGAVAALAALTEDCGGYYESSGLSNGGSWRSAHYTVRVPAERYREYLTQAGQLCHMLSLYEYADDVSEVYYDTAGRLQTQQTKLARLQELLAQAQSMEDIIALESAISETEELTDRLSGQLRHYDALVDYSTVTVYLQEVYRLSNTEEPTQSFGGRVAGALRSGWTGFVEGMENLLIALAYGWMWLVLAAVIVAAAVLLCRKTRRHRKKDE